MKLWLVSTLLTFGLWYLYFSNFYLAILSAFLLLTLSYLLTAANQMYLFKLLAKPYFSFITLLNKIFRTKFHSLILIGVGKNLLPFYDFGYRNGVYIGRRIVSLEVGRYLEKYIDEKNWKGIKVCSNWLLRNYEKRKGFIVWKENYKRPDYGLSKGWVSGMYQSFILKSLYKLYELTKQKEYFNLVWKGLKAFEVDLDKGGLRVRGEKGWWYPEYGQINKQPPFVLNGMIYALLNLHFLYKKTGMKRIKKLFDKGVREVLHQLDKYDCGNWSYYDRIKNKARFDYHLLHIKQMEELFKLTKKEKFNKYKKKWSSLRCLIRLPDERFFLCNILILNFLFLVLTLI